MAYKLDAGFCTRVNTIPAYIEANKQTLRGVCSAIVPARRIHPEAQLDPKLVWRLSYSSLFRSVL